MAEPVSPNMLTEDQLARRQRIIAAGLVLLERNEYGRIQIKDVAEEADVALGTLYHYFSSKEHLFAEVLVKWAATLRASLTRHPPQGLTPREKLTEALHRSVRAFQNQPQLARLIASLELSSDPFATEILERMDQTTSSVYMELLDGIEPGRARRSSGPWMLSSTVSCAPGPPGVCPSPVFTTISVRVSTSSSRKILISSPALILSAASPSASAAKGLNDATDAAVDVLGPRG